METTRTMLDHGHSYECGEYVGRIARCSYWRGRRQDNLLIDTATLFNICLLNRPATRYGIVAEPSAFDDLLDGFLSELVVATSPDAQNPDEEYPADIAAIDAYVASLAEPAQEGKRRQRLIKRLRRIHQRDEPLLSSPQLFSR